MRAFWAWTSTRTMTHTAFHMACNGCIHVGARAQDLFSERCADRYTGGGMPLHNRTLWPYKGGAISIQPGWFQGHVKAFFYVNMGINGPNDVAPPNMSHILVPPFQILGPTNNEYPGQFCLPQVPMPVNLTLGVGHNVTLQIVEVAQHGAALYNVRTSCLRFLWFMTD
jgi:hypothetical protein